MKIRINKKELNLKECKSLISQVRGLMFRFKLKDDGLIFVFKKEKKVFLHMFFVFFSIDIICLDKDKKFVRVIKNVKSFTPLIACPKCKYVLELKSGLVSDK